MTSLKTSLVSNLCSEGIMIYLATSASEGSVILEQNPIQLVITDQRMPKVTGMEFLEQIAGQYPDVMRIILTGYSDIAAINKAIYCP